MQEAAPKLEGSVPGNSKTSSVSLGTGDSGRIRRPDALVLGFLVGCFLFLQFLLPLRTAIKIGADEDYELSKAVLCLHRYHLYTEIWDDQPPLDTFIIMQAVKHISYSILIPRLLTVGFAVLLLGSVFVLVRQISGLLAAGLTTAILIGSPGFLELSSSCMQEIPALAPAVSALCVLEVAGRRSRVMSDLLAGTLFAVALQMKLIGIVYSPLVLLILLTRHRRGAEFLKRVAFDLFLFSVTTLVGFVVINYLTGNPLMVQVKQAWAAHFASIKSFEYGSPAEYPFDWSILLKNWETTVPALAGIMLLLRKAGEERRAWLPLAWLVLTLAVFAWHKPWWEYYYVHNAIPLCWCAGVGLAAMWEHVLAGRSGAQLAIITASCLCGLVWMGARLYLEEVAIRSSPKLYTALVLKEIKRYKPFTTFMFSDRPIYSFHADIPMPPHLAMISLKRLWTGEITGSEVLSELESTKPGLILLANDAKENSFQDLLNNEYKLVYRDDANLLYAHRTISRKAPL